MNWKEQLYKYFGFDGKDGTYWHILTRVKEARQVGTLTIDDYQEMNEEDLAELESFISTEIIEKLIADIPERSAENYIENDENGIAEPRYVGNKELKQQLRDKWL
jgi:hypothetical protein